ncbi:hypothetical protein AWB69_00032 [Caballeronia udeis]|uniref:Uncharacterized protein n=1 Tax=Caballeronia udeis TaxID=1232866 RepID=A0A158EPK4_9BURK|nr:hypothetical protein [Caballeronia udeis]SAL09413.1 hypothetical protein AWB69_00032 [Caballeronia udeis]
MIHFTLTATDDSEVLALRSCAPGGDADSKPPFLIRVADLTATLLILLRAAQMGVRNV